MTRTTEAAELLLPEADAAVPPRLLWAANRLRILGNHDDCHMVGPMEAMGIRMLVNEDVRLTRGRDVLQVVGTDDVHYYFLSRGRRFYRGTWKHRGMVGITNAGAGTSGVPVRFHTRGEILVLTLRCAALARPPG